MRDVDRYISGTELMSKENIVNIVFEYCLLCKDFLYIPKAMEEGLSTRGQFFVHLQICEL